MEAKSARYSTGSYHNRTTDHSISRFAEISVIYAARVEECHAVSSAKPKGPPGVPVCRLAEGSNDPTVGTSKSWARLGLIERNETIGLTAVR